MVTGHNAVLALVTVSVLAAAVHCAPGPRSSVQAPSGPGAPARPSSEPVPSAAASEPVQADPPAEAPSPEAPTNEPGWLGIELTALPPDQAGVLVRDVFPGSPAQLAGLQNGDIILQLDGSPVGRPQQVIAEVLEHRAGERLGLVVMRQGDQRLLNVLLGRRPDTEDLLRQRYLGAAAPDLSSGQVAQGTAQPSLHGLRGRVVVLEFWASWCLPCRALMPTLNGWHDRFAAQGVTVIGVTADSVVEAASHATTLGMRYNILADPDALITRSYRALALPTLFVIDKRGNVRDVMVGFRPDRMAEIGQLLERLIKES